MTDQEKIIDALKTIKEICDNYNIGECDRCPLGDSDGDCRIEGLIPANWNINEPEGVWRAVL